MNVSWLSIGDPFPDGPRFEIINTQRAYHYAKTLGNISWLQDCGVCPAIDSVSEGAPWSNPASDGAPWYDPNNPDTDNFYGVVGIDVIGAESSTRSANVTQAISGGGVVGPNYFGPRTLVVRGLAIAADECGLAAGLDWLGEQYIKTNEPCAGDTLTYFDCCPCICTNQGPEMLVCWARNYAELRDGPTCPVDWWPTTYAELRDGPPISSETWCSWPQIYRQLREGPPAWSCCVDDCVTPYFRQLRSARIVSGPTMIDTPKLNTCGAMALFEFTIVAADPHEHAPLVRAATLMSVGGGEPVAAPKMMAMAATSSPSLFGQTATRTVLLADERIAEEQSWEREETFYDDPTSVHLSGEATHLVRLAAPAADTLAVRIGVWDAAGNLVTGYYVPYVPVGAVVVIDEQGKRIYASYEGGVVEPLNAFVRGWDTESPPRWVNAPVGGGALTIDRIPGDTAELLAEVMVASMGV